MTTPSILKQAFAAEAKALADFGYPDVTASRIEEAHQRFMRRDAAIDVIDHFAFGAFREFPEAFGDQPPETPRPFLA